MEVSARIVRVFPQGKTLKAVASVTIEGCFVVHGVKIIETEKGVFIAMPSEKRGENYRDICHPIIKPKKQGNNDDFDDFEDCEEEDNYSDNDEGEPDFERGKFEL